MCKPGYLAKFGPESLREGMNDTSDGIKVCFLLFINKLAKQAVPRAYSCSKCMKVWENVGPQGIFVACRCEPEISGLSSHTQERR